MLTTPDVTPAQILSVVTFVVTLAVGNLWIDSHTGKLITDLAAVIVPAAWMVADAIIRHGRATGPGTVLAGRVDVPVPPANR